ncbi:MAG: tetratricopeptide repeat protein [Spirochaetes bacterium]|nr:tetratricopeptide repeat protein [Spirochaetota bacterium]
MDNRKLIIIIGVIVVLLIIGIGTTLFFVIGSKSGDPDKSFKKNTIALIKLDMEAGYYDRALDKVEELLKKDINDEELLKLRQQIITEKEEHDLLAKQQETESEQENLKKLMDQVNTAIEKNEPPPVIVRTTSPEDNNKGSKEEQEKRNKINQLLNEGIEALNNQNYAKAKSKFEEVLKLDKDNAEALALLSRALYEEDPEDEQNIDDAVKNAKHALKQDNNQENAHYTLAKIYDQKGLLDLAEEEYIETIKLNPQNYQALYSLGKIYYKQKKFNNAYTQFNNAVKIKKDFVYAYFYLGRTSYQLKQYDKAINNYSTAAKLDPNFVHAYGDLGEVYRLKKGDYKKALDNYQKAAQIENDYHYYFKMAICYENLNQMTKAIDHYLKSISLNPQSNSRQQKDLLVSYISLSNTYLNINKNNEAINYTLKGLKIDNTNANLYYISAQAKEKSNDVDGAITDYQNAIKNDPEDVTYYVNLSSLYSDNGRYDDAITIALDGVKVKKDFKLYNNMGDSLQNMERYDDAINAYVNAITLNNNNAEVYFNLGYCYKKIEKQNEAIDAFRKAININKEYYNAYFELGHSYFGQSLYEEAKTVLEILIQKKPNYDQRDKVEDMLAVING